MKLKDHTSAIIKLKQSFQTRNLTLYLGAGVSIPTGLPSWEQLVVLMYFRTLYADLNVSVYSNYLLAIADWLLQKKTEPLDVIIRKIKNSGWSDDDFMNILWESLYSNLITENKNALPKNLLGGNNTLKAITESCARSMTNDKGVRSIITYNYDNLLEMGLTEKNIISSFQIVFNALGNVEADKIPIYHVHGYIPMQKLSRQSAIHELVFSEDQYNNVYQDSYFWGNMVQMQNLASHTGLMIGVSLTDRNVRRLLDAVRKSPITTCNYLLLKESALQEPLEGSADMKFIHDKAMEMLKKMEGSGVKKKTYEYAQVKGIFEHIRQYESSSFINIYRDMGLDVLLYEDHDEIPEFLKMISD